jgi:phage terminase large subunit-like protein
MNPITNEKLLEYKRDICIFLEDQYILEDGSHLKLEEFQKKILRDIFQTKDKNGLRKYHLALCGFPKKNGKSTLASGVALYMLFCDVFNAEVFGIAGDKDQAKIIFNMTKKAIERNPLLLASVKIYRDEIVVPSTDSLYKVLSADAPTSHGLNPTAVIADEIHTMKTRDLLDALTFSPVRKEPLYFYISYAGTDFTSPLYELYQDGIQKRNPKLYFFWSEKNLASWITPEYLEGQRRVLPAHVYQRLHENKWVQGENSFISKEELYQCVDHILKPQLTGRENLKYYLAIDLGLVRDRTVLTICHKDPDDNFIYLDYIKTYKGTKKSPVLVSEVEKDILWANENFNIIKSLADFWQMAGTVQRLKSKIRIENISFSSAYIQKISQNLFYLFHNNLIRIFPHKDLETELLNLNCEAKSYGWRIDHKSGQFSDHVISLGMAALEAVNSGNSTAGVYFGNWK